MSIARGLVGWWRLDGRLVDESGAGLTLDPAFGTTGYVAGKFGQAANFTGSNALRMIQTDATLADAMTSPSFTVSAWLNPSSSHVGYAFWMALDAQPTGSLQRFSMISINGDLHMWGLGLTHIYENFFANSWKHYAITATAGGSASFFVNGALVSTQSGATARTANNAAIGCRSSNAGFTTAAAYFQGQLQNLTIYNRALAAHEIRQLYALGSPIGLV